MSLAAEVPRVKVATTVRPPRIRRFFRRVAILPIRFYQVAISPYRLRTCRFYPSCSQYAVTSLLRHGVFKGSYLAAHRIFRCHPWSSGGVDHVPE